MKAVANAKKGNPMNKDGRILEFTNRDQLHEQAGAWVVRLDEGPLSAGEAAQLKQWAAQSEHHTKILVDTARIWDLMDVMAGLSELLEVEPAPAHRRRLPALALLALAAVLFCVGILTYYPRRQEPQVSTTPVAAQKPAAARQYHTDIGANDVVVLEDGSVINLNTATRIQVDISKTKRSITLLSGEAYFDVAHNVDAPFVVSASGTEILAVGTAFSVQKLADRVEVTVAEGIVQVQREEPAGQVEQAPNFAPILVRAGQVAQVSTPGVQEIREIEPQAMARKLLWQQKILAFDGNTLQEVVAEYSRYTPLQIEIADAETAAIRVGGYFRSDNIAGLLTSLEQNFSISVKQTGANRFELQKNQPPR